MFRRGAFTDRCRGDVPIYLRAAFGPGEKWQLPKTSFSRMSQRRQPGLLVLHQFLPASGSAKVDKQHANGGTQLWRQAAHTPCHFLPREARGVCGEVPREQGAPRESAKYGCLQPAHVDSPSGSAVIRELSQGLMLNSKIAEAFRGAKQP